MLGSDLRTGWVLPVALGVWAAPAVADEYAGSVHAAVRRPWVSPPGWLGPGPAWHGWSDPGPGNGWRYYGVPDGPYVTTYSGAYAGYGRGFGPGGYWGVPGAAGSFWTNGRSLYGPPVPVYGPTPGVFGSADDDRRFFRNPPPASSVWVGLGWHGYRSPSPRHVPLNVSVYPAANAGPSVSVVESAPAVTPAGEPCLRLTVRVPDANAAVWIGNAETTQRGAERLFESPPLEGGKTYKYEVVAKWTDGGRERAESRTVLGKPGQTIAVDFSRPADTETAAATP